MAMPIFEILIVILLILGNGLFAMAEIAIVSARKERLQGWVAEGRAGASAAMALAEDPNRFLATIQIGITLIGIFAGAFGGATIADRLATQFDQISWLAAYSNALSVGIVVVVIAYFSLVVGELVPKRLGMRGPEGVASSLAPSMRLLSIIAAPLVGFLSISTNVALRLLRASGPIDQSITEEEINVLMREGLRAGSIEAGEQQMVSGVFRLHDRPARAFMTLGQEIVWLDVKDSIDELILKIRQSRHLRFPVCEGSLQNVIGVAVAQDLLVASLAGEKIDLSKMVKPMMLIPETSTGSDVLNMFLETNNSAGLVIDEHGVVLGMVTINDILDEIVGEDAMEIVRQGDSWVVDGRVGMDDLRDVMQLRLPLPDGESDEYESLGGFVMARLERIPSAGESFVWSGIEFRIQRMEGNRVSSVKITPQESIDTDTDQPED